MGQKFIEVAANLARYKFWATGAGRNSSYASYDKGPDVLNNSFLSTLNPAGDSEIPLIGLDSAGRYQQFGQFTNVQRAPIVCQIQPQASILTGTPFYVNNSTDTLDIVRIDCIFKTANGAALTGYITKEAAVATATKSGAPGTGALSMTGTFDLNATANTLQTGVLAGKRLTAGITLAPGEQLSLVLSTTTTSLAGLEIMVWARPFLGYNVANLYLLANAAIATKTFFLNIIPGRTITGISARWSVAGSDAGAVTGDITKDTGTSAPGAGTSVLSATFSLKGTANTTIFPTLSGTAANLLMASGDRLAFKLTGTPTALAGLVITVFFDSGLGQTITIPATSFLNQGVDFTAFIAERYVQIDDAWFTWSAVGGGGSTVTITADRGTTAPGAGTAMLTAAIDTTATANTPVEGTVTTNKPVLILAPGDRLGVHFAGTVGTLAGLTGSIRMRKL